MERMHPILIKFGNFAIYTYGLMMAIAFFVGITLARKEADRVGQDPEKIMDLSFYILIGAVIGSRLFYVFTDPRTFLSDPIEIFRIWNGGLVFYGGLIGSFAAGVIFIRWKKFQTNCTLAQERPVIGWQWVKICRPQYV